MRRAFALILPLALAAAWNAPFPAASAAPSKAAPVAKASPAAKSAPAKTTSTKTTSAAKTSPMDIEAKTTEYDGQKHTYTVTGNVRITLEDLIVTCAQATIFASEDESRVERVRFNGDVVAKRGTNVFTGETVTFDLPTRRLLAEGGTKTRIMVPASSSAGTPDSTPSAR
ncbi:Lipopolysaccharide export system protein LptA [compost metagenome]